MRVIFPLKVCCKYFTPLKCCTDLTLLTDVCTKLSQFRIETCKVKTVEIQDGFVHTNFSYRRNGTKVFSLLRKVKAFSVWVKGWMERGTNQPNWYRLFEVCETKFRPFSQKTNRNISSLYFSIISKNRFWFVCTDKRIKCFLQTIFLFWRLQSVQTARTQISTKKLEKFLD